MSPIISVENLSKSYTISHQAGSHGKAGNYRRLSEELLSYPRQLLSRFSSLASRDSSSEEFWALKDVSFEVNQGEVVGIIGRNGAGKSTLLKILSRITEPTSGRVTLRGRVASLLEVGTGFHPELTGRENIFLNGAILGMTRGEIKKKFDEIVDFAGVEKFLDTPVKRYSSGMYVRLAFAVAAHLEPEVLVVDEVLAVGDVEFQKKCLGKMRDVASCGRTVLFVSHNMSAIEQLCRRLVLFESGKVKRNGIDVQSIIRTHAQGGLSLEGRSEWTNSSNAFENPYFQPLQFGLYNADGTAVSGAFRRDNPVWVVLKGKVTIADPALTIGYNIHNEAGQLLYRTYQTDDFEENWRTIVQGEIILKSRLPDFLNEGVYILSVAGGLHCREWLFAEGGKAPAITCTVEGGISRSPYWTAKRDGAVAPVINWH